MVEERLASLLTLEDYSKATDFAWHAVRSAVSSGYYIHPNMISADAMHGHVEPVSNESETYGRVDRDVVQLMWKRLPAPLRGQARVYLAFFSSPLDTNTGDALAAELNPLNLRPINDDIPGARRPPEDIRILNLLRGIWESPGIVDGIFAAFTWELSFPHLDEVKCTFEEMLSKLYHWMDRDGKWSDSTFYVRK